MGVQSNQLEIGMATSSTKHHVYPAILNSRWIETPLGDMLAVSDDESLYLLEFRERRALKEQLDKLRNKTQSIIMENHSVPIASITAELHSYFNGTLKFFKTPIHYIGTPFQRLAWETLLKIPYGETISYAQQACAVDKPTATRAVANANGANNIAIVVPCHRIINSNGALGGYAGGLHRKQWLIDHEKKWMSKREEK